MPHIILSPKRPKKDTIKATEESILGALPLGSIQMKRPEKRATGWLGHIGDEQLPSYQVLPSDPFGVLSGLFSG